MQSVNSLHENKMKSFIENEKLLPKKELKLSQLIKKKSKLDIFNVMHHSLDNDIRILSQEIETIKSKSDQIEYISNVTPILYKQSKGKVKLDHPEKPKSVGMMKFIEQDSLEVDQSDILNEYLSATTHNSDTKTYALNVIDDTCKICFSKMFMVKRESTLACPTCGDSRWVFDVDVPQWRDSVEIITQFVYERISHFKDHLKQFQGKEIKSIPDEVVNDILMEMGKMRISPIKLTREKLSKILKKLKKSTYYSNVNSIYFRITGVKPPQLSPQLEERLIALFKIIQAPFELHKPKNRKNFFSYSYTIHKLLEIIAIKDPSVVKYIPHFQMLKNREKTMLQDATWKKICNSLGWVFKYSI